LHHNTQKLKGLHSQIQGIYNHACPHCELANGSNDTPINSEVERIAKLIYDGKWNGKDIDTKLTQAVAKRLLEYYASAISDLKIEPDNALNQHLQENIYHFSAAKNFNQLRTLSQAVYNAETGRKTSFKEFKKVATAIDVKYNKTWLRTEQDQAYASAQMASKWHSFDNDSNLKYKTAGDGRVRASHQALSNIVKPKTDDFWNTFYPPNGWACRCNVIETNSDASEGTPNVSNASVPPLFRTNTAKDSVIFPLKHPYFKDAPKELEATAKFMAKKELAKMVANNNAKAVLLKPIEKQFKTLKKFKNGGVLRQHLNVDIENGEYKDNREAGLLLAQEGGDYSIMPTIDANNITARKLVFPNLQSQTSNPDLRNNTDNYYVDVKRPKDYRNIQGNANKAYEQGAIALLKDTNMKFDEKVIEKRVEGIFNTKYYQFDEVYAIINGKLLKYKRDKTN
jgi:Phage Mu protein F like protein